MRVGRTSPLLRRGLVAATTLLALAAFRAEGGLSGSASGSGAAGPRSTATIDFLSRA